ncbi:MAG TPA: methyltransferase domain-containing protein [Actinomycetes bacterium]
MAEAIAERVQRYILDGSDADLRRLLGISQFSGEMARAAFRRVGMQEGWKAIDCGCGPIGGLAVMAELVGPGGRVVGVDASEAAVRQLDAAAVGGPFDLAYTRLFLVHQVDPVRTLSRIAGLLRPGGWVVAHEPLRCPAPRSQPHLEALGAYWELLFEVVERVGGAPHDAVDDLARWARAAGLEVVRTDGCFFTNDPTVGFELHASTLAAARGRAVSGGVASEQQVDELVGALRAAKEGGYEWVSSPFFRDLTLRKPTAA